MSPAAAVAVARSNAAPTVARPAPATQTQSTPRAGAMQNVATPAVTLAPANRQSSAVQASASLSATPIPAAPERSGGIQKVLDKFAEWSNNIPGFRMLTIILGFNPINMRAASRNPANLLRALIELVPGGAVITQALDNHGVINQAGAWLAQQIATLGDIGGEILGGLNRFLDSLGVSDLAPWNWGGVWDRAKQIFTAPITRLISFGVSVATDILAMVKQVILKPLAALAKDTRGYDLLKAILGEDPITGEKVPRNAENLIGGFMKFIGQEEIWENIKKGNAIARAWTWFQGALKDLMGFVRTVPRRIIDTLSSLTFQDILTLSGAFMKVAGTFISIAGEFIIWGLKTSWSLLEIIFDVVKPGLMVYIKKTGAALKSIIKNPLPFVGNLVKAAKLGFQNFADNFDGHLKKGLIDWLTGSLEGVYIPTALSLPELGKFAMSVLGITWGQIRGKIVKALGSNGETIMKGLETGFDIVVALVTGGPAAAWELIKEKLTDLKDQVVSGIISFVTDTVIKKAVPKLIAMFIPGAGFISAIISIYDTIMVFVEKISKIIQVVVAFIDSIVAIAGGNITAAANRVEKILGGLLSLAISFLAGFLGLGKITDKIMGVIEKVRTSVDKALDKAVEWIVDKAKKLYGSAKSAAKNMVEWWKARKPFKTTNGESHEVFYKGEGKNVVPMVASEPKTIAERLDEFSKLRTAKNATEEQKKADTKTLISETQNLIKKTPESPLIISNVQKLFNIFFGEDSPKEVKYTQQAQPLPGDPTGTVVGRYMRVDWLTYDYIKKNPGSAPGSGQDKLMDLMVSTSERGIRTKDKFIRGHLLNENLGGKGENKNLFPITGYANSQHLHSTEKFIKNSVAPIKGEKAKDKVKKQEVYVKYEVKVQVDKVVLVKGNEKDSNYVNSTFFCKYLLNDATGKTVPGEGFETEIQSEYKKDPKAIKNPIDKF